jgi:phage FluMu gp28-like protein
VVIDEAAWIPDVDTLWQAIVPTISTSREYRLSIVSTPGPRAGMFHRLWNNGDKAWSRHCVNIYDARAGEPAQRVRLGPWDKRNGGSQLLCAGK